MAPKESRKVTTNHRSTPENLPSLLKQRDFTINELPRNTYALMAKLKLHETASKASTFKAAEPLTTPEVSRAFQTIYKRGPLRWPKVLQVDSGREFMGEATRKMAKHNVRIRKGHVKVHRDQGIVEQFNQTSSERLFTFQ